MTFFAFAAAANRALPVLLCAAGLLLVFESFWLLQREVELDAGRTAIVGAALASTLVGIAFVVLAVLALGARLVPRFPALLLMLCAVWPASLVVESLFSGGRARAIPYIEWIEPGFAIALVLSVPVAVWIFQGLARLPRGHLRRALAVSAALAAALVAYLDTRLHVGLYPAAHYLLAGAVLYCAALAAVLAITARLPRLAHVASAVVVALAFGVTALTWRSADALTVATYSDGLMPKVRGSVVGIAKAAGALGGGAHAEATVVEMRPHEFRFEPTHAPELDELRSRVRNVVFVLTDAVRNDHVGMVRGGASITPFVDTQPDLIRFQNAYAGSDATGQSMPVLMTSYPFNVTKRAAELAIPLPTWIEMLRERGYATFANGNCGYVAQRFPHVPISLCYGAEHVGTTQDLRDVHVPEILDFVVAADERPFAVFTHWMDAHIVKSVKDARGEYAAMISQIDARLRELVAGLARLGHADDTMIVWTADHGYLLGERNRFLGGQCCVESLVRVPLFVYLPGSSHRGAVVEQNVSAVDVMPTILDVLAPDQAALVGGRSLLSLLYDERDPRRANQHMVYLLGRSVHMIRQGALKMQWDEWRDTKLVVDVDVDPDELAPIVLDEPRDRLWRGMEAELAGHARLGAALTVGERDVDPAVVATLLRGEVGEREIAPFLEGFWQRSPDTRRLLLHEIVRHRLEGLDDELEELARTDQREPTDELLLVTRAFVRGDAACEELAPRVAALHAEARTWLAETYAEMSEPCQRLFTAPLLAAIRAARELTPELESPEGHFVLLGAAFVARTLDERTPEDVKVLLRDLFNESLRHSRLHKIPSVRGQPPFDRRLVLLALEEAVTPGDLDILAGLTIDKHSIAALASVALKLDTPQSIELVRAAIGRSTSLEEANAVLFVLRNVEGPDDVGQALSAAIAERFPRVNASI
jgi:arylsulfatase A-like enzyme